MAYADFATAYLSWLQSQIAYVNDEADYQNFTIDAIDPTFEVTSFKNSTEVNQLQIFHNAADDQVAYLRSLNEMTKTPSDYLDEYVTYLEYETGLIQNAATNIVNIHTDQTNINSVKMLEFMNAFAPDAMIDLSAYNPMRII
jgi:hypothetical protein